MFAVISDIHGNLEAIQAVLYEIQRLRIRTIYCLGDIVGYGADPGACLNLIATHCTRTVLGNHEFALRATVPGLLPSAQKAIDWTRTCLKPHFLCSRTKRNSWSYLNKLPDQTHVQDCLFVHGSPRDPLTEYLTEADTIDLGSGASEKITENLSRVAHTCFVGHTHIPGVIDSYARFFSPCQLHDTWRLDHGPTIVNVGSVGQPRDHDPRASFISVIDSTVRFHRVPYNIHQTQQKIRARTELDSFHADRLGKGV